ncbi:MAG: efflux RND transporter periplasmic adaptor subunit [Burkholderiales bacterium]
MRIKPTWLIAATIVVGGVVAFSTSRKQQPQYFTSRVERGDIRDVVEATGTINAVTTVLVGSQISGRIAKLSADFNSVVRKGQIIAEIDPALFQGAVTQASADLKSAEVNVIAARAGLDKAKAALVQTRADYERALVLAKQDSIATQAVDFAKAAYDAAAATVAESAAAILQAEAQVKQKAGALAVARTNLEYTVIRSPIDGTVVARNVDVGQTVAASLQAPTIFTIAQDLTKMQVYAKADESNVGKVKVGRTATFKVDAFPKDTFSGLVSHVRMNPTTLQNVVTYDAIIDFDNPERKLFPGMTAYVTIPVASARNVLKIPNGALRYRPPADAMPELPNGAGTQGAVWKLRPDQTVERVPLALGITDHSYTEVTRILSGDLTEGDDLITAAVPTGSLAAARSLGGAPPRK